MQRTSRGARACAVGLTALALTVAPALVPAIAPHAGPVALSSAWGIGEKGPFDLRLSHTTVPVQKGKAARFDINSMMRPEDRATIRLETITLQADKENTSNPSKVLSSDDDFQLRIENEGTWRVKDGVVAFSPVPGADGTRHSVQLTVKSKAGHTSNPVTLVAQYPYAPSVTMRAAEGVRVNVPLGLDEALVNPATVALDSMGMPEGTVLTRDGSRMVVPNQGTWTVVAGGKSLEFEPRRGRLGRQITPVTYTGKSQDGVGVPPGTATVHTPIIRDVDKSTYFGMPVVFSLSEGSSNVNMNTLKLVPYDIDGTSIAAKNDVQVRVSNQGTWTLDRGAGLLRFVPASQNVRDVTPMGVRGTDVNGNESAVARMSVGYPEVELQYRSFVWGQVARFQPFEGSRFVKQDSFAFETSGMPDGTRTSSKGRIMDVPGQGRWRYDAESAVAMFTPVKDFRGSPAPASFTVMDVYGRNSTTGVLTAVYASEVPVSRDDEVLSNSQVSPVSVDVLANDTPASAGQSFDPTTITLRGGTATNIQDLVAGSGKRLVIPNEGTFEVSDSGSVRFTPAPNFVGKTKAIEYIVTDSAGLRTSARLVVEVEPALSKQSIAANDSTGINALLSRLLPGNTTTFSMYASITALFLFTGVVSVWVGRQLERGRSLLDEENGPE